MENAEKKYKAKLRVETKPFSYIEIDIEDTSAEILRINRILLENYPSKN